MCGIVAYLGQQNAYEIIIKGLQRLGIEVMIVLE